jgi:hypothetical protein
MALFVGLFCTIDITYFHRSKSKHLVTLYTRRYIMNVFEGVTLSTIFKGKEMKWIN